MAEFEDFISEIRNANPLENFISSYISLKKSSRNYVGNCPFHSERTPSFTVFTDTQSFYCFGCHAGGDVITFTMKMENLEFIEALKFLAEKSNIPFPEKNTEKTKNKTRIYEMNRLSANFFYNNLLRGSNKAGLNYFISRGISAKTIKKYGLGFASDSWNELTDFLLSKGYKEDEIVDAWLGKRSNSGRLYDIFRNRVIFPIVDLRGNVIGFGGRVLDDSKPKYLNTGATPVFDKGSNLFSLNHAKSFRNQKFILCEGYMDVISLNQAGFETAVATLGTALTPSQARILKSYTSEIILSYDSDSAGQNATRKAINIFSDVDATTKILQINGAKDPDEFIKKFGAERFRRLIDNAKDSNVFVLDSFENGVDINSDDEKNQLLNKASRYIAEMKSPIERELYISRIANKYNFPVNVLREYIDNIIRQNENSKKKQQWEDEKKSIFASKEIQSEERIISYLIENSEDYEKIETDAPTDIFITEFNKRVYSTILSIIKNNNFFSVSLLNSEFSDNEMGKIIGIMVKNKNLNDSITFAESIETLKNQTKSIGNDEISNEDLLNRYKIKKQ
ncbi:MAG: DNA primase [Ruminococcus sp.]|nr:DNA primase [Ruminococcus sp.]